MDTQLQQLYTWKYLCAKAPLEGTRSRAVNWASNTLNTVTLSETGPFIKTNDKWTALPKLQEIETRYLFSDIGDIHIRLIEQRINAVTNGARTWQIYDTYMWNYLRQKCKFLTAFAHMPAQNLLVLLRNITSINSVGQCNRMSRPATGKFIQNIRKFIHVVIKYWRFLRVSRRIILNYLRIILNK